MYQYHIVNQENGAFLNVLPINTRREARKEKKRFNNAFKEYGIKASILQVKFESAVSKKIT